MESKVINGTVVLTYKDFQIEIDEDVEIVRVMKGDKIVKFWYNQDDVQIAKLPKSSTVINEYTNVFDELALH